MDLPENKLTKIVPGNEKAKWKPVNNHNINNFTEDELKRITDNYATPIGKGAFGEVYRGDLDDGSPVAVKVLKNCISPNMKEGFYKEMTVHCQINHKNVVRLLGYCSEENALMMVTEYISRGSLRNLLHDSDLPISLDARMGIAIDCAEALSYMHSSMYQAVIHGDIKPDNILLDGNMGAKLSDFGISSLHSMELDNTQYTRNVAGSRGYVDPEHLETGRVDPKNDVYSFGVVLVELVTRAKVCEAGLSTGLVRKFTQAVETGKKAREMFDTEIAHVSSIKVLEKIGKLAAECLRRDIKKRPDMKDVAVRLRNLRQVHCQQGQEKTGQWSLWGAQDTTQKVSRQGASISSSDSTTALYKLNSLDIFNWNARRNLEKHGRVILEKTKGVKLFKKGEVMPILKSSNFIGKAGSGEVYKGILNNELVAVKMLIGYSIEEYGRFEFANEVIIQSQVIHKNIVRLIGCCLEVEVPMLVYEFPSKGSLDDILHGDNKVTLSLAERLSIAAQSADGLAYMHSKINTKIIHGDVKLANILLDDQFVPKISEFGLSRLIAREKEHTSIVIGDMSYMDPVYLKTGLLTEKSDVYSYGVMLLELISRKRATYTDNNSLIRNFLEVHKKGERATELFDKEIAVTGDLELLDSLAGIAMECLHLDVDQRPEMTDVAERLLVLKRSRQS